MPCYWVIEATGRNGSGAMVTSLTKGVHRIARPLAARVAMTQWRTMLTRFEQSFASWNVAGTLFLLLVVILLACLITLSV